MCIYIKQACVSLIQKNYKKYFYKIYNLNNDFGITVYYCLNMRVGRDSILHVNFQMIDIGPRIEIDCFIVKGPGVNFLTRNMCYFLNLYHSVVISDD